MSPASTTGRPKNVVVLFTDQQRWDTVSAYGAGPMDLTPNIDAMARRGVRFDRAFTCQPVCAPARGSLQTGEYATTHTVWRNGLALPTDRRTLAHHFADHGYRTGYIGKWHLAHTNNEPVPRPLQGGYADRWLAADVLEFTSHPYETILFDADGQRVHLPGYRVDALAGAACQFIDDYRDEPFFLFLSWLEPHQQNDWNRLVAPDGYAQRYANPYVPPDLWGVPGDWMAQLPDYYGMIARIDECVGRILGRLDQLGLSNDTIVLFTSDHGCHFRTRNTEYKRSCHESSIRIPLVMQGPGLDRSQVVPELVSLVDVPPTLLDAAGLPVPDTMQGRSAVPLVDRCNADWPDEVFVQISEYTTGRAIRTARWKYCVHAPECDRRTTSATDRYVERHMYDLAADPHERVNLIGRPDYRDAADRLAATLKRRMLAAGEPEPHIVPATYYP